jgi:hypothetical protein
VTTASPLIVSSLVQAPRDQTPATVWDLLDLTWVQALWD